MSVEGDKRLDRVNGRSGRQTRAEGQDALWRGFVNRELTVAEKEQFDDWSHTAEPWDTLASVVGSGAHVAVKINPNGGGFLASVTQRNPGHPSGGLCVTARSGEAGKALFRVLYIVALLGVDSDWGAAGGVADPDRW